MKIEKIEPTGSKEYVRLRFADGTSFRMPSTVAADLQLRGNQELDEETFARVKEQTGQASAKMRAVRIIAASGVSEKELRRRLVQKGERPEHGPKKPSDGWTAFICWTTGRRPANRRPGRR